MNDDRSEVVARDYTTSNKDDYSLPILLLPPKMNCCHSVHYILAPSYFVVLGSCRGGPSSVTSPLLNRSLIIISLEPYYVSTYERARNGIIKQPLLMSLLLDYIATRTKGLSHSCTGPPPSPPPLTDTE